MVPQTPISSMKIMVTGMVDVMPGTAEMRSIALVTLSISPLTVKSPGRSSSMAKSVARVEESMAIRVPEMNTKARRTPSIEAKVRRQLRATPVTA